MIRFVIATFLACVVILESTTAQSPPDLAEGQRIRLSYRCEVVTGQVLRCGEEFRSRLDFGHVQAIGRDSLRFRSELDGADLAIPVAAVTDLSVAAGRKSQFWTGATIGLLAGALVGAVIGSQIEYCILSCEPATGIGAILGLPIGFFVGGVVGGRINSDQWVPVPVGGRGMGLAVRRGAIAITVPAPI